METMNNHVIAHRITVAGDGPDDAPTCLDSGELRRLLHDRVLIADIEAINVTMMREAHAREVSEKLGNARRSYEELLHRKAKLVALVGQLIEKHNITDCEIADELHDDYDVERPTREVKVTATFLVTVKTSLAVPMNIRLSAAEHEFGEAVSTHLDVSEYLSFDSESVLADVEVEDGFEVSADVKSVQMRWVS